MGHSPLDNSLKGGRRLGDFRLAGRELCQLRVDKRCSQGFSFCDDGYWPNPAGRGMH